MYWGFRYTGLSPSPPAWRALSLRLLFLPETRRPENQLCRVVGSEISDGERAGTEGHGGRNKDLLRNPEEPGVAARLWERRKVVTQEWGRGTKPRAGAEPQTESRAGRQGEGSQMKKECLLPMNPDLPVHGPSPKLTGVCFLG